MEIDFTFYTQWSVFKTMEPSKEKEKNLFNYLTVH